MKMHTDNGFTFDIKEDHATVMEIDGDPQNYGFPVILLIMEVELLQGATESAEWKF